MEIAPGLLWKTVYFTRGAHPNVPRKLHGVRKPPTLGNATVFIIDGKKQSTIFCPYTFQAFAVDNNCVELSTSKEPMSPFDKEAASAQLKAKWAYYQNKGVRKDYAECAKIMLLLGNEVPKDTSTAAAREIRCVEPGPELLKPFNLNSKRGKFVKFFLDKKEGGSLFQVMAELSVSRASVSTYLCLIQKEHGLGFSLSNGILKIMLPEKCKQLFVEE